MKLAFNSIGCGLAVVDDTYDALLKILPSIRSADDVPEDLQEVYAAAKEGKYIVDDDCDELAELQLKRNSIKYSNDVLALTIAPTLECNFRCIYCYETPKPGIMSEKVQYSVVEFLSKKAKQIKKFDVTWYGGEPLVAKSVVCSLSEQFVKICADNGIEYGAYMVSNGSLLDDDMIAKFHDYKITGIQITLDGVKDIHDKRRVSKDGVSKFDKIVNNINKLLKQGIDVAIRVNVDKNNSNEIESLISYLSDNLISKSIKFGFGQVVSCTSACKNIESNCYNTKQYAEELFGYYEILHRYGFMEENPFPYPDFKVVYCMADIVNSYVVDPSGYLYKCWNDVGEVEKAVGNLCDKDFDALSSKHAKWILRNPMDNKDCLICKLLPVCMGGCPHKRISENAKDVCDYTKYVFDKMLGVHV